MLTNSLSYVKIIIFKWKMKAQYIFKKFVKQHWLF